MPDVIEIIANVDVMEIVLAGLGPVNTSSVAKAGDTMTGPLALYGDAIAPLQPTTLQQVQALIAAIVASSPALLDTLNELALALGSDPNFATTVTNNLALKANGADTTAALATKALLTEAVNTVAAAGAARTIPNVDTATISRLTLTAASCTLTFPATVSGKSFTVVYVQDGTGGRVVVHPANVKWPGGFVPILSSIAGRIDYISYVCTDGVNWAGFPTMDVR